MPGSFIKGQTLSEFGPFFCANPAGLTASLALVICPGVGLAFDRRRLTTLSSTLRVTLAVAKYSLLNFSAAGDIVSRSEQNIANSESLV